MNFSLQQREILCFLLPIFPSSNLTISSTRSKDIHRRTQQRSPLLLPSSATATATTIATDARHPLISETYNPSFPSYFSAPSPARLQWRRPRFLGQATATSRTSLVLWTPTTRVPFSGLLHLVRQRQSDQIWRDQAHNDSVNQQQRSRGKLVLSCRITRERLLNLFPCKFENLPWFSSPLFPAKQDLHLLPAANASATSNKSKMPYLSTIFVTNQLRLQGIRSFVRSSLPVTLQLRYHNSTSTKVHETSTSGN